MSDQGPSKSDIQEIFRRLQQSSANRTCFDCNARNPSWASVTYGVFICIDCSAVHRGLGVHLSFVRSTQLDTNWTWQQLRSMQLGGNANATTFFCQHNCETADSQQKYNSRAAALYRERLVQLVTKHNRLHGLKIVFDAEESSDTHTSKESDFFEEIGKNMEGLAIDNSARLLPGKSSNGAAAASTEGPNVMGAFSASGTTASSARKPTIGQRKPTGKSLGAKKGGLGAQKVKADFSEIEREAIMGDEMKERREEMAKADAERHAQDQEKQMASMSLAYQDISKQQDKRAEHLKKVDPKKADQVERLGMGIGMRSGVSHSAFSDMKTIDQETPVSTYSKSSSSRKDSFFDEYDADPLNMLSGFSSKKSNEWDIIEKPPPRGDIDEEDYPSRPKTREPMNFSSSGVGDEAQKKFGNAKAISSDQFFSGSRDNDYERRTNLSRFEGQTSISSADYFGDSRPRPQSSSSVALQTLQNVDLDDVRESVRQGVTKVAGRLSNIANGMMSSLQEKYGY